MALELHTIIASTRPGRVGPKVAAWFQGIAAAHPAFDARLVDLADFQLPVYDEPKHPRLQDYQHEHTRRWSASVAAADAFVLVTPEYNYFPTPALVNALDFVSREWMYKPAAFVSYGGVSGGLRAVQAIKPLLTSLKIMPMVEAVVVQRLASHIKEGAFEPTPVQVEAAGFLLDELARWAAALKPMRTG